MFIHDITPDIDIVILCLATLTYLSSKIIRSGADFELEFVGFLNFDK